MGVKVEVVGNEPPRVTCVVLPQAGWPGEEAVAWAGAGAACLPPWTELSKVLTPGSSPSGAPTMVCPVAPGITGSFKVEVGLQRLSAGRLVAPVTKAMLSLQGT